MMEIVTFTRKQNIGWSCFWTIETIVLAFSREDPLYFAVKQGVLEIV